MKYAIIIPDGCADEPLAELGGRTPLQAARLPHMDRIARDGVTGLADNVPDALTPASDVATLSVFGYDPLEVYTGRSPLEAVAMGIRLGPDDWAVRCNLVNVRDDKMHDFTAGHVETPLAAELVRAIDAELGGPVAGGRLEFVPGVQYRHALIFRADPAAPFDAATKGQPPHDIPERPVRDYLPTGPGSEILIDLMERSKAIIARHAGNAVRKTPVTQIWLWGMGRSPKVVPFAEQYGLGRGAIISGVDLVRGVGMLLGWERIDAPGSTAYLDTDYASKGRTGVAALADHDIVCVHIEAPDEASHEGRADAKVEALERIDAEIVGPMRAALEQYGEYRILVTPDHRTLVRTKAHSRGAVPFVMCGSGLDASDAAGYDEMSAAASGVSFRPGHLLMRQFLDLPESAAPPAQASIVLPPP